MADEKRPDRVVQDDPSCRPLERFWPYADLPEQPTDEELAKLHPDVAAAVFGTAVLPFSISLAFPRYDGQSYARAVELTRASDEYVEVEVAGTLQHRARFFPSDRPVRLRDLYEIIADVPGAEVLVDDRPVPYARELWLPLVWCLIR